MGRLTRMGIAFALTALASQTPAAAEELSPHNPPVQGTRWNGFHIGGFFGAAAGSAGQGYWVTSDFLSANLPTIIPFFNDAGSQRLDLRGVELGLEGGYDAQAGEQFVIGVLGDLSFGDLGGSRSTGGNLPVLQFPYTLTQKLSSPLQSSLRLRAGVTPMENLFLYATGGLALGRFHYESAFWDQLTPPFLPGNETENVTLNAWRLGWTLGAGAEWALNGRWSLKSEYRFSQFSGVSGAGVLMLEQPTAAVNIAHSAGPTSLHSLRFGFSYSFD